MRIKYPWVTNEEYKNIYTTYILKHENDIHLNFKKQDILEKYSDNIKDCFLKYTDKLNIDDFNYILVKLKLFNEKQIENLFVKFDINNDNYLSFDEFITFLAENENVTKCLIDIFKFKYNDIKEKDKRFLLFKDFPGSPLKLKWRPSLSNLRSPNSIKNKCDI